MRNTLSEWSTKLEEHDGFKDGGAFKERDPVQIQHETLWWFEVSNQLLATSRTLSIWIKSYSCI